MGNIKNIYFDWNKAGSCQVRQYDHLSNRVVFGNAPKFENYYLLVTMKESEIDEQAKEMNPVQLTSPVWLIPNSYTQMVQQIKFQICNQAADGTFEQHSAEYIINVVKSHGHEGEDIACSPSSCRIYIGFRASVSANTCYIVVDNRQSKEVIAMS